MFSETRLQAWANPNPRKGRPFDQRNTKKAARVASRGRENYWRPEGHPTSEHDTTLQRQSSCPIRLCRDDSELRIVSRRIGSRERRVVHHVIRLSPHLEVGLRPFVPEPELLQYRSIELVDAIRSQLASPLTVSSPCLCGHGALPRAGRA